MAFYFTHGIGLSTAFPGVPTTRFLRSDHAAQPQYIQTVPGQGYHFIAPVLLHHVHDQARMPHGGLAEDTPSKISTKARFQEKSADGSPASASRMAGSVGHVPTVTRLRSHWRAMVVVLGGLLAVAALFFSAFWFFQEPNRQH